MDHATDKEMDMLADRIAEKVLRGGMGERHGGPTLFDKIDGTKLRGPVDEFEARESGPLFEIEKAISRHTVAMTEVANKLNAHADRVMGRVFQETDDRDRGGEAACVKPTAALDRIFVALGDLDRTLSGVAQAAGRNSTLA